MIARLRGTIEVLGEDSAVIDVGGVGYLVACSGRTLGRLSLGSSALLLIETHVREDAILLYGFFDAAERDWFRLLITVQGVGARLALSILSAAPPDLLARALAAGDKTSLTRANGVGPKLAVRILTELKDKAATIPLAPAGTVPAAPLPPVVATAVDDAVSALVNLGYRRLEAFEAVAAVAVPLGEATPASALIGAALKRLGREVLR